MTHWRALLLAVTGMPLFVLAHGGSSSTPIQRDGPEAAARKGLEVLAQGGTPLGAAVEAVALLEDDPRFNAGTGSSLRFDGETIEMDAACMDSGGRFGAVAAIRDVKNPVRVARDVLRTPHNMLAGEGATRFARCMGYGPFDARTREAQARYDLLMEGLRASHYSPSECAWSLKELEAAWNYPVPLHKIIGSHDTVGAVATDGGTFAAALSTGGIMSALLGRVGDVPLPGCGLWAGKAGAVALTGQGDLLSREMVALRVHRWLEEGASPDAARARAIRLFPDEVEIGLVVVGRDGWSGGSNRDMAWAAEEKA